MWDIMHSRVDVIDKQLKILEIWKLGDYDYCLTRVRCEEVYFIILYFHVNIKFTSSLLTRFTLPNLRLKRQCETNIGTKRDDVQSNKIFSPYIINILNFYLWENELKYSNKRVDEDVFNNKVLEIIVKGNFN